MRHSSKHSPRLAALLSNSRSRCAQTSAASSTAPQRDTQTTCLSDLFPASYSKDLQRLLQPVRLPKCLHYRLGSRCGQNAQLFVEVTARLDRGVKRQPELPTP